MAYPSSSSSSSFPSSSSSSFTYDVFLSFRGSDTRRGFTGNLYRALEAKGSTLSLMMRRFKAGTEKIQIIIWKMKNYNDTIDFDGKAFKKMEKLKTFIVHDGKADHFNGDLDHLPNGLRVLEWQYYPFPSLPFGSHPDKLNILRLSYSCLKSLGLFKIEKLKELTIEDYEIIFQLPSNKIRVMFPSLQHLKVDYTNVISFHISDEYIPARLTSLTNLRILRHLSLRQHHFTFVPSCITELHSLKELHLSYCFSLVEIRWIPPNLEELCALGCNSLKYLDLTSSPCLLRTLQFRDCNAVEEIRGIPPTIQVLSATNCTSLTDSCRRMLLNQELHEEIGSMMLCLPGAGSRIPEWFEHCSTGHSLSFWFRGMFPAISTCHLIGVERFCIMQLHPKLNINGNTVDMLFAFPKKSWSALHLDAHHIFIFDIKQIKFKDNVDQLVLLESEWNHAEFSFHAYDYYGKPKQLANTQIGLHVFKQESSNMKDIRFTNPYEIERNDDDDDDRDSNSTEKPPKCGSTNVKVRGTEKLSCLELGNAIYERNN
ncbi:hypothetical protein RIF29_24200 [Crotalaria pallida]|uniref:TIR domain-containing protein n=1 Tax=Crotalaria pallida TaxID=3830 RepID=A0AAN9EK57_CROPI